MKDPSMTYSRKLVEPGWNPTPIIRGKDTTTIEEYAKMRPWQEAALIHCRNTPWEAIVAASGSGKSLLTVYLATDDIISSNYKRKQLILVPQKHIGNSFSGKQGSESMPINFQGKKLIWAIHKNCCSSPNPIKELKKFLLSKNLSFKAPNQRIISGPNP